MGVNLPVPAVHLPGSFLFLGFFHLFMAFGVAFFSSATLPETNSSPLKMDGWNTPFLLGRPFQVQAVSFREATFTTKQSPGSHPRGSDPKHLSEFQLLLPGPEACGRNQGRHWVALLMAEIPFPTTVWMVMKPYK